MRNTILLFTIAMLASAGTANAQPDSLWSRTFGREHNDVCFSAIQTEDGGYALAGITESFGASRNDFWLVKTDADGDSLWSQTFGRSSDNECKSLVHTADGGYALAGFTYSSPNQDMWLVRTNAEGDSLWSRTFGGAILWDMCYSIIQTANEGYALAGRTASFGAGDYDMWLVRTNADGDSLWSQTFGGRNDEECFSIIQTADGGYALAGYTRSFGAGDRDMWLVKTDADGDSLWS